jgi:hypothetical protein
LNARALATFRIDRERTDDQEIDVRDAFACPPR